MVHHSQANPVQSLYRLPFCTGQPGFQQAGMHRSAQTLFPCSAATPRKPVWGLTDQAVCMCGSALPSLLVHSTVNAHTQTTWLYQQGALDVLEDYQWGLPVSCTRFYVW